MRAQRYFVIAAAGARVFATGFQDFPRRTSAERIASAEAARLAREAERERSKRERDEKIEAARRLAAQQRMELEEKRESEARAQAGRAALRQQLTPVPGECAGFRRNIEDRAPALGGRTILVESPLFPPPSAPVRDG